MILRYLYVFALLLFSTATAQWQSLNPGAGGQIQDIVLDANRPGRVFYMSDMEGCYRTDDHGATWQWLGEDLHVTNTLTVAIEPGNSDRLYIGTLHGLQISDNAGVNWRKPVPEIRSEAIQEIVVAPDDPDRIYAGPGGTFRWAANVRPNNGPQRVSGAPSIWRSTDRGETWTEQVMAPGKEVRREIFSICLDPNDSRIVYVASRGGGIFLSTDAGDSWSSIASPESTTGESWGAALSPDGQVLYATFVVGEGDGRNQATRLFATRTAQIKWTDVSVNGFPTDQPMRFWLPEIDPRSSTTSHKLLISQCTGRRIPLYEVSVQWGENQPTPADVQWRNIFWHDGKHGSVPYDIGWEHYQARPLHWRYTPISWGPRGIWTTADQTLFACADTASPDFPNNWEMKYCAFVRQVGTARFYRTTGLQCTFTFDGDMLGPYALAGQADNAVLESFDGGVSWTLDGTPQGNRTNAVAIVRSDRPIAVAHVGTGFGANSNNGKIFARRLPVPGSSDDPGGPWRLIGGGPDAIAGLRDTQYQSIVADPLTPSRIYVSEQALWVIDDIAAAIDAVSQGKPPPNARKIKTSGGRVVVDLNDPNRIYVGNQVGSREPDGSYGWAAHSSPALAARGSAIEAMWQHDGKTFVLARADQRLLLSTDGGRTFNKVFDFEQARSLRRPSWFDPSISMSLSGVAGGKNYIVCAYGNWGQVRKHYGVFKGVINDDGSISWSDSTGNLVFGIMANARVNVDEGKAYYLAATQGAGLWRLDLD